MAINLSKGQKIGLTQFNPGLKNIMAGLGWDISKYDGGSDFRLDAAVFMTGASGKVEKDTNFVFYNNRKDEAESVICNSEYRIRYGDGDDETVNITLDKVPADVEKICFTVTIYKADERGQNFGQVSDAYIRIVNAENGEEFVRYDLGEDFSVDTAIAIAELYRYNGEWKFATIGSGFTGGLAALCENFGVDI